jgi:small subunit ribosomal protein S2
MNTATTHTDETLDTLFKAGAHYGVSKTRRHPSVQKHLYGQKQAMDLFDLEKTQELLEQAKDFVRTLGRERKLLLFVGGKPESHKIVREAALRVKAAYVVGRWIGGSLTNHSEIKKRVARMQDLIAKRDSGALSKYTKFERLQIDREIEKLETMYAGLAPLNDKLPHALFVVDPKREAIAVSEAQRFKIPVVALANSDCNLNVIDYPIPANDAAKRSIDLFVNEIANAYEEGLKEKPVEQSRV